MISEIRIKNMYSIKDSKIRLDGSVNGLYGSNGSGKSSFIRAIEDFMNLVMGGYDDFYPFTCNVLDKDKDSSFSITYSYKGNVYDYEVITNYETKRIVKEVLKINDSVCFTREYNKYIIGDSIKEISNPLLLCLRKLYMDDVSVINDAYLYLTNISIVLEDNNFIFSKLTNYTFIEDLMVASSEECKKIVSMWKDFPIYDFFLRDGKYYVRIYNDYNDSVIVSSMLASKGMIIVSKLLSIIVNLDSGSTLFIDSIEKSLNYSVIKHIIKECETRNIKLVFTSHNTKLIKELDPNNIYFAFYNKGESKYYNFNEVSEDVYKLNNEEIRYLVSDIKQEMNELVKC